MHSRLKVKSSQTFNFWEIHNLELSWILAGNLNYFWWNMLLHGEFPCQRPEEESKIGSSPPPNALVCA